MSKLIHDLVRDLNTLFISLRDTIHNPWLLWSEFILFGARWYAFVWNDSFETTVIFMSMLISRSICMNKVARVDLNIQEKNGQYTM